jgi:ADP-ribosyl-[dinitrogen reductase] hydrolase
MLGAIIGDMVGSIYEFRNYKATDFEPFLSRSAYFTDDTIMTIAVADGLLNNRDPQDSLRDWGRRYWSNGGWGQRFASWLSTPDPQPYDSFGNGAAMRISAVAWLSDSYEEAMRNADRFTEISHNHPEGMKAARATVSAIWWAREGLSADQIRQRIVEVFEYDLDRTTDEIRPTYFFSEASQKSVPEALVCALEGNSYEEVVRLAISIGGDSDTIAAIAGSVAEARFGIPEKFVNQAKGLLQKDMLDIYEQFARVVQPPVLIESSFLKRLSDRFLKS